MFVLLVKDILQLKFSYDFPESLVLVAHLVLIYITKSWPGPVLKANFAQQSCPGPVLEANHIHQSYLGPGFKFSE